MVADAWQPVGLIARFDLRVRMGEEDLDRDRTGSRARNLGMLGQRREVLVEKEARRGGLLQTRTRDFKTVIIPGDSSLIGSYQTVELSGTTGSTFTGFVVRERTPLPVAV